MVISTESYHLRPKLIEMSLLSHPWPTSRFSIRDHPSLFPLIDDHALLVIVVWCWIVTRHWILNVGWWRVVVVIVGHQTVDVVEGGSRSRRRGHLKVFRLRDWCLLIVYFRWYILEVSSEFRWNCVHDLYFDKYVLCLEKDFCFFCLEKDDIKCFEERERERCVLCEVVLKWRGRDGEGFYRDVRKRNECVENGLHTCMYIIF